MAGQHGGVILGRLPEGPNNGSCSSSWKVKIQKASRKLPQNIIKPPAVTDGHDTTHETELSRFGPKPVLDTAAPCWAKSKHRGRETLDKVLRPPPPAIHCGRNLVAWPRRYA
nr:uncharacterized protein LOC129380638 isoform X2 [Dermacentor andersoni]